MATAAARRYARAVFELAREEREVEEWGRRLSRVRELFSDPKVAAVLSNPTIPTARREGLVTTSPRPLDDEATNLARLLIESGRVAEAAGIEDEFERLADEAAGRVRATVTTAIELSADDRDRVARELSKRLDKQVRLNVVVDPRVVGGLKLQYGDRVVDATVANRLQQLRRRLAAS
ncbi:MAG TPA: F0F1 ATP synthase subunit delta [Candidatus Dormibacteraeota bacterium]|nr:F0F1 ATP synthase subunit delta [Candidatus Dormibacteraeota bacterium]